MNVRRDRRQYTLPGSRYGNGRHLAREGLKGNDNVRFPWIHSNDPDAFQSVKVVLSVNHVAVP